MKKSKQHIRLATRDSKLALWQANFVQKKLKLSGITSELVLVNSQGDMMQQKQVKMLQSVGIFTKAIDDAVLNGRADAGIHSLKDLPTTLHRNLQLGSVLKRADSGDVLVYKDTNFFKQTHKDLIIATGSARRKAQWKYRYPHHKIVGVRGNVDSRLQKLQVNNWDGIILAAAGLKRLKIKTLCKKLDWMIPAPGQGAIAVVYKKHDKHLKNAFALLNHDETLFAILAERSFLHAVHAGCSSAVGAHAQIKKKLLLLEAEVLNAKGDKKVSVKISGKPQHAITIGKQLAQNAIRQGAGKLLNR